MKAQEIKIDFKLLNQLKKQNIKERKWFIDYWVNYIKTHSDEVWSEQQKMLIDSQILNSEI